MNQPGVTTHTEFVLRRLGDDFNQFVGDLWRAVPLWLLALAVAAITARLVYRSATKGTRKHGQPDPTGTALWWAAFGSTVALVIWFLAAYFHRDNLQASTAGETAATGTQANSVLWVVFTSAVFLLGLVFVVLMYLKDTRSIRWPAAVGLATVRILVYAILCFVFLLPAVQKWERVERKSRVVVLLDVSPSMTTVSDEVGTPSGVKPKFRMTHVLDFLTDDKVAFVQRLTAKNPVVVYRFGNRLDEDSQLLGRDQAGFTRAEWEAFASYDLKPFILRSLSAEGREALGNSSAWEPTRPGNVAWAESWLARPEEEMIPAGVSEADAAAIKAERGKLAARINTARTILQGTNVVDSVTAAVNREAPNMVQGVIVISDGRGNLGSDSGFTELKERATREKIPIFTVAVGEDRQAAAIAITDLQAPDTTPPDEPFKVIVEADGVNLAQQTVEVMLDLFGPGKNPKEDRPDVTLDDSRRDRTKGTREPYQIAFAPGDPPHGQVEFVVDPAQLPAELTVEASDAGVARRVLKEGQWSAVARIKRHEKEAFPDEEHLLERPRIQVIKKPLRVLLVASGPSREYQALRTLLVREMQENRAELCILLQNEGGLLGNIVQDVPASRLLVRWPTKLDTSVKRKEAKDAKEQEEIDKERFYNLNEYDLIIAFDPDLTEITKDQADQLKTWVQEQGGGLIFVADQVNTYQLARVEANSRLSPILDVLPVVPADRHVLGGRPIPRTPRRLYLNPIPGSDLLKLDEEVQNDPVAGWERFFTDRPKYVPQADLARELFPRRGFMRCYPVKEDVGVKAGAAVLAEFADRGEFTPDSPSRRPWLVTNNPAAGWRTAYMASGEMHKTIGFDKELFNRFWVKLTKYMAAKRNVKAARGRVLIGEEYVSGGPVRVQARVLNQSSKPYPPAGPGSIDPKFRVVQIAPNGDEKHVGLYPMTAKQGATEFDGYYQGQFLADPTKFPPGDADKRFRYRVVIDVPDSAAETIEGEFKVRLSNPEKDNTRPDIAAMRAMAGAVDADFAARLTNPEVREKLLAGLPAESGVQKLAFRIGDPGLVGLIPECMKTEEKEAQNRGPVTDLWDKGFTLPAWLTSWWSSTPVTISYVMLLVIGLLCVEWVGRKLLRLA